MVIREMRQEDLAAVNALYNWYIRQSTATWRLEERDDRAAGQWFAEHQTAQYFILVAYEGDALLGFAGLSSFRAPEGYWPVAENSVYVQPGSDRRGIGTALMQAVIERARTTPLRSIVAVLDSENQGSRAFHQKLGFVSRGILPSIGEKFGTVRSAEFLQLQLK